MKTASKVCVIKTDCFEYPQRVQEFHPSVRYPEYTGVLSEKENKIYDGVREALHLLGLDEMHYGTADWNPLGEFVKPGMVVLIKPNLVVDSNSHPGGGTDCLYTQPAVVAPVIDYVLLALQGNGRVVIGDAPMQRCNFDKLTKESGYRDLVEWYVAQGVDISLVDFRGVTCQTEKGVNISKEREGICGKIIDLGKDSEFADANQEELMRMRVTNYDPRLLYAHHQEGRHEYEISEYILDADVIINMPKPKTHRKAGVTISLKNFVGANVRKEFLPHHTNGAANHGGDEYDKKSVIHDFRSFVGDKICICEAEGHYGRVRFYQKVNQICTILLRVLGNRYSEGSWYGNKTICRTIADINKLVYYAGKDGKLKDNPVRKILIIADMIISGEKEGPVAPTPKNVGIIAAGINPVCFDEAIATLMGMDAKKIPTIQTARKIKERFCLVDQDIFPVLISNDNDIDKKNIWELREDQCMNYVPTKGWEGHIEREKRGERGVS